MDGLIETALRNSLHSRPDLFGEDSTFVGFETQDENSRKFDYLGIQSSLRFGRIVYRRRNQTQTEHSDDLLLKLPPPTIRVAHKELSMLQFFNETFFYTKILTLFRTFNPQIGGKLFPQYYNSVLQYGAHADLAVILFENLRSKGYCPFVKKTFLDYDHLRLMMRKLGEFHAYSYRARQEVPDKFHALVLSRLEINGHNFTFYPRVMRAQTRGFEPLTTDPDYFSRLDNLRHLIANCNDVFRESIVGDESNPTHVLCHGDFLSNNVLFAYDEGKPVDMKMVDFGTWRFGSPVLDLTMVLYVNADQKMRDENWGNLLDEYFAALRSTFPSTVVPTRDTIMAEFFSTATIVVYYVASYFLPMLLVCDNDDVPSQANLVPPEFKDTMFFFLPPDLMDRVLKEQGGESATLALTNILKDMIDRGFV